MRLGDCATKVLIIAEAANPDWVSVPLVGWSLASAIARKTSAHLVTQVRNRVAILRTGLVEGRDFTAIDSEVVARPLWRISNWLRGSTTVGWTTSTALSTFAYYYFERLVWKQFGRQIEEGAFDLVHRVTPLSPTTPSMLAKKCFSAGVPFVMGPLNGGVRWPNGFGAERRKEREWLSYIRGAHKFLPGSKSSLERAAALIVGSRDTLKQIPDPLQAKCVYLPENGVDPKRFSGAAKLSRLSCPLNACFVGRLVPYKGPDMMLEAVIPLLRSGELRLDVLGDGPLMPNLRKLVSDNQVDEAVTLHGWIEHSRVQDVVSKSDIFIFPSIREFGGAVVLEAMALGVVPIVVDYAGPGELVDDEVGFKVPIGTRTEIVHALGTLLRCICDRPHVLDTKSIAARARARDLFSWDAKAEQILEIYEWVLKRRSVKPAFFIPRTESALAI